MKSKKLISFLCAAAMTVSSFAGLAITASAAPTEEWSNNFNATAVGDIARNNTGDSSLNENTDRIPGLAFLACTRDGGDAGQYTDTAGTVHDTGAVFSIVEKSTGDNYLHLSYPMFGDYEAAGKGRWGYVNFTDGTDAATAKTYTATADTDYVFDFDLKLTDGMAQGDSTDRNKCNPVLRLGTFANNAATAIKIDKDAAQIGNDWVHARVVVTNSGSKLYIDKTEVTSAAASNVKAVSTIGLYSSNGQESISPPHDVGGASLNPDTPSNSPIADIDNLVIYSAPAGETTGESTAPGAKDQEGGATPPPVATEAPIPAAPVLTVPEGAEPQVTFDFEKYNISNSYYMQADEQNITDIEGMNIHFGSKAESSTRAEIVKTDGGNAFQLASGRFCTGARGPRVSFTNPMEVNDNYTVIGFAFKLSAMKNHAEDAKPRLYLIKDAQQTGDDGAGGYRNIAAVLTAVPGEKIERNPGEDKVDVISKEVTADEWHLM